MSFLSDFRVVLPRHVTRQENTLAWIARAHAQAAHRAGGGDLERLREGFVRKLARYGCGEDRIASRGHELNDLGIERLEDMEIVGVAGGGMSTRMAAFARIAEGVMEGLVPSAEPPAHLLHVTCTGYVAPSAAQTCVARRGWGQLTTVTHVYHSGCYAAFPAVRLAGALITATTEARIAHTEICTLHFNPEHHAPEQLVVQSLFADGHVSYRVTQAPPVGRSLEVLALREEILPDSLASMTWQPEDWGFGMTLGRDVPDRIAAGLPGLLGRLAADLGFTAEQVIAEALFVVHPGGPRILDIVQDALRLADSQLAVSRAILLRHGNMSSATIPHAWRDVVAGEAPASRLVVSCAFGPGLTASAGVFRVHEQSVA